MGKISRRPAQSRGKPVGVQGQIKQPERENPSVHAKDKHVLGIIKGLFGPRKTRYKPVKSDRKISHDVPTGELVSGWQALLDGLIPCACASKLPTLA